MAILYDLIRLEYPKQFLYSRNQRSSFQWSLEELKQYDVLLSISNETKKHWSKLIGVEPAIYIVQGGSDAKKDVSQINFHERRGVLCIGAEQPHKNLERLISAYSQIPISLQLDHPLTILGIRSKGTKARLAKLARKAYGEVNFPDYLDSYELNTRYENARLLVMPSLIEGLSLPIFEAWSHGLIVIASGGTVADELINDSHLMFDPYLPLEMAKKIQEFLTSESEWIDAREKSIARATIFTWSRTAKLALQAVEDFVND
jgi:glycosyltransferase involved in cell wall biosynthesis